MKRLLTALTLILGSCHPVYAEGAQAYLYNKPVLCANTEQEATDMMQQIKSDGMKPLMYWRGNSFNGDNTKFLSNFFLMYDPDDEQLTVVEQQASGFTCIDWQDGNDEFLTRQCATYCWLYIPERPIAPGDPFSDAPECAREIQ